ncbi:hypothetical protein [Photobacterium sp. TY1-4]|uniref:hypothetical protein n=1 Tax=Photobacterium sp. TY1-4 TaxID=2899122 RepID=UPI0021BDF135|nr:hypothetical protein [Photobacterium sp. TY1-4]UXI02375.1 hypothetical protein NH461_06265 [Photobacterium sp. TY1-4]
MSDAVWKTTVPKIQYTVPLWQGQNAWLDITRRASTEVFLKKIHGIDFGDQSPHQNSLPIPERIHFLKALPQARYRTLSKNNGRTDKVTRTDKTA